MERTARAWQWLALQAGSQDRAAREAAGRRRAVLRHIRSKYCLAGLGAELGGTRQT